MFDIFSNIVFFKERNIIRLLLKKDDFMPILEIEQVRKKLTEAGLPVNDLIEKFWRIDSYDTVLNCQLVVDHLITFVKEKVDSDFTKFEFYKYFFDQVTIGKKFDRKKLWELALIVETKQKNEFENSEFKIILDNSGVNRQELIEAGLIVEKGEKIGFFHHTVSEFLVAEKWICEGNIKKGLEGLLITESGEVLAINNSWYGVIIFLLDSNGGWSETYEWLWDVAIKNSPVIDEGFSETITSIDPNRLDAKIRSDLFGLIFQTYLKKRIWIPLWTRAVLPSFCEPEDYENLKNQVMEIKENDPYFLTTIGNILDVVARLMEDGLTLINSEEKNWWRGRLVGFANSGDENGVIQRHALSALSSYKGDLGLVEEVSEDLLKHESNLVREAYLDFCSDIDPNSEVVIDKLVKGLTEAGEEIYSRHGLYKISNRQGIIFFLRRLSEDDNFLRLFLDKESIFNGRDKNGDEVLITKIQEFTDNEVVNNLKLIIQKSLESKEIHNQERSYFIRSLVSIVVTADQKYVDEVLNYLEIGEGDKAMRVYDYIPFFVWGLTPTNVEKIYKKLAAIDERSGRFGQQAIYRTRYECEIGKKTYEKAVELGIVEEIVEKDWKEEQNKKIYREFKKYLGNEDKKTYYPIVFQYFHQNEKVITGRKSWTIDKKRLEKLVVEEGLKKIDPRKFNLKITKDESGKRVGPYTISSVASYFGDLIKTALLLGIKITDGIRQNVIDFIPFAYSDDWQTIKDAVGQVSDAELEWVNNQFLSGSDIKYFLPESYVYFVRHAAENKWGLTTSVRVLKSIAGDKGESDQDRRYALEILDNYIGESDIECREWLHIDFDNEKTQKVADDLLISVFKDRGIIENRIQQIKAFAEKAKGFKQPQGGHSVGEIEEELMEMHLAKCFISTEDTSYKKEIMFLVDHSFKLLTKNKDQYWSSVNYIWGIFSRYLKNIRKKELSTLMYIEGFLDAIKGKYETIDGANWFRSIYEDVRRAYLGSEVDFDSDVKLVVLLEGPTDVEYVNSAINKFGWKYRNMVKVKTPAPNVNGEYCSNSQTMLHCAQSDLANPSSIKTPRLYLFDIGEPCANKSSGGRIFRKSISAISTNPFKTGIENLFTTRTLNKISKKSNCVVKKQIKYSKSIEYDFKKKPLCDWLCVNGTVADYKYFKTNILNLVESVLAELQSSDK